MDSSFSQAEKYLLKPEASIIEEPEECDEASNKSESLSPEGSKAPLDEMPARTTARTNKWIRMEEAKDQADENMRTSKYCAIVD